MRYANDLRTGPLTAPAAPVWPLFAGLGPLGALPTAGRLARAFTALVLTSWRLRDLAEDRGTVTGELVANVVQAATGPDGQPWYDEQGPTQPRRQARLGRAPASLTPPARSGLTSRRRSCKTTDYSRSSASIWSACSWRPT
jgi:hypothetical protein